jgi:diaminohydroxyphosphoribosylaminopyrimidine deaminase / 5-amino-6-(5-phosphoribosylamino)uracil reductase
VGHLKPDDARWMGAALALGARGRGRTRPNPNIGCVIVSGGRVIGRGWTQAGGRPHAEAMALAQAGAAARGATVYVTLEPCAHESGRGPACADLLAKAGVARVVAAAQDPDLRTAGRGLERLSAAGIAVACSVRQAEALASYSGFIARQRLGRPQVTLKLATSLDGCIALADGSSRWITGEAARAHAHLERSRHEGILVGRGTWETDAPKLDVRLEGLEERSPVRVVLSRHPGEGRGPEGKELDPGLRRDDVRLGSLDDLASLPCDHLLVEGGAQTAAAFVRAGLIDRLLLYRAPVLIGAGKASLGDIGLTDLAEAHGRWTLSDARQLGSDRLEVYVRQHPPVQGKWAPLSRPEQAAQ